MGRGIAKQKKTLAATASVLIALLGFASLAQAGLSQTGNLQVSFEGQIIPTTLPRKGPAPVSVQMSGSIKTTDKSAPPRLERISLQINRNGSLSPTGLGRCPLAKIETGTGASAKAACGSEMIGHGNVTSRIALPDQEPFLSVGGMEAFNGAYHGHPAIFAQVVSGPPLPLTYVIVFAVRKSHGTFGTALDATIPPIASGYAQYPTPSDPTAPPTP